MNKFIENGKADTHKESAFPLFPSNKKSSSPMAHREV